MFGDYLDPLTDRCRLILVDQRSQGRSDPAPPETWTLAHMAADVDALAGALDLQQYAVLGHSFGSFVALQHAVDSPGRAWKTIVSGGVPASRYLSVVDENLASFQPEWLREQVSRSWEREKVAQTEGDVAALLHDQMPFHFANPVAPILGEYEQRSRGAVYSAEVLRHFANQEYGAIDVEARLGRVTEPVLVLAGRHGGRGTPWRVGDLRAQRTHDLRRGERGLSGRPAALPGGEAGSRIGRFSSGGIGSALRGWPGSTRLAG
jgi:proline iminopeptidase